MAIKDIKDSDFENEITGSKIPVFVDFWAPWCGPCKLAAPVIEELSGDYKDKILFLKINVDENSSMTGKYQVMSIPTTILFKDGKEVERCVGFSGKKTFEDLLKRIV